MTKVLQLEDLNTEFWKEKFISGLPTLFAEKVRNSLRVNKVISYENLHYDNIKQTINQIGLNICAYIKIRSQLKNQNLLGRK